MQANLLIVDNNRDALETYREFFEQAGYSVLTASSVDEALERMTRDKIDLAVIDIRLVNDEDEKDLSGLKLAREGDPRIKKIILTRYPTVEAVRQSLGPDADHLPSAVAFVAKQEGLGALQRSVQIALAGVPEVLENRLLSEFSATNSMQLINKVQEIGAEEATLRLRRIYEGASEELTRYRHQEKHRAEQYHIAGMVTSGLVMVLIVASIMLIVSGQMDVTPLPLIVTALVQAIGGLFFIREDAAHKRVGEYFAEIQEINRMGSLLVLCDSLERPMDREIYKKKVIDMMMDHWSKKNGQPGK